MAHYQASGLTVTSRYAYLPDHLAVQTEYLYLLAKQGERQYREHALPVLRLLLEWLPEFHQRVTGTATLPFYRAFTGWFLELARRDLSFTEAAV